MPPDPAAYGDAIAAAYDDRFPALTPEDPAVVFLAEHADGGPALELGIGTGRVALPLAARGIAVHGIDASVSMVERLRAKPGGAAIPVAIGDFRDVPAPAHGYGLVYVVFNTLFGLLTQEDQVAAYIGVADRLRPGGRFVVEAFVPDPARFDRGQRLATSGLLEGATRFEASEHDAARQRVDTHELNFCDGRVETLRISIRYAWPSELDLMARLAGLSLAARYGSWTRAPFRSGSAFHVSVYEKPSA